MRGSRRLCGATVVACLFAFNAQAGLAISGTRVVLTQAQPEQTLRLLNGYSHPVLLQAWTGDGSPYATPDTDISPVITLPPVFKLDPGEEKSLRLIFDGSSLPANRESVFWLNLYEVPALKAGEFDEESVRLQVATRTQMKVFVRPEGVADKDRQVAGKLKFTIGRKDNKWFVRVNNGSSLHASFSTLSLEIQGQLHELSGDWEGMLAPGAERALFFGYQGDRIDSGKLTYALINDLGQVVEYSVPLTYPARAQGE
ncbi:hypothetical protein C7H10_03455 [Marinobacter shengliensis]|nr:hypothetical protein C7H10_03455 [Marinobacter shengliensis]